MQIDRTYKVALVDESLVTRTGLEILINGLDDFEVSYSGSNVQDLIPLLWRQEMILYSFSDYNEDIRKAITAIQSKDASKPILAYCPNLTTTDQLKLVSVGVKAILAYTVDGNNLANALRCVAYGGTHFPERIQAELRNVSLRPLKTSLVKSAFSEQKLEILTLIASGCTSQQIADQLNRSKDTIDWHKKDMRRMTGTNSSHELLQIAYGHGLLETPSTKKGLKKTLNPKVGLSDTSLS